MNTNYIKYNELKNVLKKIVKLFMQIMMITLNGICRYLIENNPSRYLRSGTVPRGGGHWGHAPQVFQKLKKFYLHFFL